MFVDYHMHSEFSDDSQCPMEEIIEQAIRNGLSEIAFTEHVDYGVKFELNCNYAAYFSKLERMRRQYSGRIVIRKGIEFGVQQQTIPEFQRDFDRCDFDFVLLSNHQIDNREFWNQNYQQGKTQDEINRDYYEAILRVISEYKSYAVLAHLDMVKRYDPYGIYPDEKIMDLVEPILQTVIDDGKGIEVNASCFRYGLPDLTPSTDILKLYRELGGTILTIGTDAHRLAHIGTPAQFTEIVKRLKALGFRWFCTYEKMQPVYHEL